MLSKGSEGFIKQHVYVVNVHTIESIKDAQFPIGLRVSKHIIHQSPKTQKSFSHHHGFSSIQDHAHPLHQHQPSRLGRHLITHILRHPDPRLTTSFALPTQCSLALFEGISHLPNSRCAINLWLCMASLFRHPSKHSIYRVAEWKQHCEDQIPRLCGRQPIELEHRTRDYISYDPNKLQID